MNENEYNSKEDDDRSTIGLCGWYNLMDFVGRRKGQIKISIQVDMESEETRKEFDKLKAIRGYTNKNRFFNASKSPMRASKTLIEVDLNRKELHRHAQRTMSDYKHNGLSYGWFQIVAMLTLMAVTKMV